MNVNKATIVGRITSDLELKTTPTGREVLSFGMATNRSWKDQSGAKQEKTDWHNIVFWGKQASVIAQYCVKGPQSQAAPQQTAAAPAATVDYPSDEIDPDDIPF